MTSAARVTAIVPTLGTSPYLVRCLEALGGPPAGVRRVVVLQGNAGVAADWSALAEQVVRAPQRLGFSAATNLGIAESPASEWLATVNDDAVAAPGWTALLCAALEREPRAASAQGVNLRFDEPERVDGWGLAWNRRWQAAQLGAGGSPPAIDASAREVFGVSATAALYRSSALLALDRRHGIFDERLDSFYEDVELAGALRAAGHTALSVPGARALHVGSVTARRDEVRRTAWIYGNRYLVLADLLGDRFSAALPRAVRADLVDAACAVLRPRRLAGIARGWARALRRRSQWRRAGPPRVDLAELARLEAPAR